MHFIFQLQAAVPELRITLPNCEFCFVDVSRRLCELQPALVEVEQQLWRLLPQRGVVDVHLLPHEGDT